MKNKDISKFIFLAIIFVLMFVEIFNQNNARHSPLYIDLMEQNAYVRRGFDHTELQKIASLPNLIEDNEWALFGKGARIIRNAPLENLRRTSLFTPRQKEAEEFTIIIPVEFDQEAIAYLNEGARADILHTAGVYFAGIGENWEIYFNGNLIRPEMHLNEAGRIVSQRFWRDLYFPIDKENIVPGANILALRILGDPAFESTGLRSRVHYIDDYRNIAGRQRNFRQIVQCAIFVFSGVIFLLIFFYIKNRKEIHYLSFSIFSLMLCVYTVMRHGTINVYIPNSYVSRLAEYLSLMLVIIAFSLFVEISLRGKISIFLKSYYLFCALLAFTQIFILRTWGEEAIMLFDMSVLVYIIYVVFYDILYPFVFNKKRPLNSGRGGGRNSSEILGLSAFYIVTGTLIMCFCGVFEIVGFVFLFDLLPFRISTLFINSTIAFQIGMAFMLSQRFGVLYNQLKQSNIMLETTVKERTRELEEKTIIAAKTGIINNTPIGEETAENLRGFRYAPARKEEDIIRYQIPEGRVLVVDDLPMNLLVTRRLLAPYGMKVDTAESGQEAVEKIRTRDLLGFNDGNTSSQGERYNLILMDHLMPGMDGVETLKAIRAFEETAPVIALTANALQGMKEFYLEQGFQDYLSKPISPQLLDDVITRWIPRQLLIPAGKREEKNEENSRMSIAVEMESQRLDLLNHYRVSFESGKPVDSGYLDKFIALLESLDTIAISANIPEQPALLKEAARQRDTRKIRETLPAFYAALRKHRDIEEQEKTQFSKNLGGILPRLKKALLAGETEAADSIMGELGTESLELSGRELYFLLYDLLLTGDTEKAVGAICLWERIQSTQSTGGKNDKNSHC